MLKNITDPMFQWVQSAVYSEYGRPELSRAWVKDGWVYGSDGHRCHSLQVGNYREGVYGLGGNWIDHLTNQPSVEKFFNSPKVLDSYMIQELECVYPNGVFCFKIGDQFFQTKYVLPIYCGRSTMLVHEDMKTGDPVYFRDKSMKRRAVVMPFKP